MILICFNAFKYSMQVWLTSVFTGPFVFMLIEFCLNYQSRLSSDDFTDTYLLMVLFGSIFSFVTWVAFWYLIRILVVACFPKIKYVKYYIALIGLLLTVITFWITSGLLRSDTVVLTIAYAVCIVTASIAYNINIESEDEL